MGLHAEALGRPDAPPVVLVHGFTQTGRCWMPVALDLAADHHVVLVDAPGHGGSSHHAGAGPWEAAALLAAAAPGPSTWVGYSMGGRLALHVALAHPEVVASLVLLGATAGIGDPAERDERRRADEALAASLERDGLDAFLDRWLAAPLFATLPAAARSLDERRRNTVAGLAASLRRCGTGAQEPLWDRLDELRARGTPVLVLAGELDAKFAALGRRLAAGIGPAAEFDVIPGAGHAAHLERPEAFSGRLRRWEGGRR